LLIFLTEIVWRNWTAPSNAGGVWKSRFSTSSFLLYLRGKPPCTCCQPSATVGSCW